jgi:hypothetical protein
MKVSWLIVRNQNYDNLIINKQLRNKGIVMKSLYDKIYEVINRNNMVYEENEFQIQLYMSKRWREAFAAASEAEGSEYDESFPPPVTIVADLAEGTVDDHGSFIEDLEMLLTHLSRGGRLSNGELA